jgi:hypothetical protein
VTDHTRALLLVIAAIGSLVYALLPPGNPAWIGAAAAMLGGEALARAGAEVK